MEYCRKLPKEAKIGDWKSGVGEYELKFYSFAVSE
jgi:hypothetical protein